MPESAIDNWRAQIRKGWLEVAVLVTLWNSPRYGLEIIRELKERSDLVVAEGTVYPVLSRLRADGLIDARWEEAASGHPRKYYSLTAAGRRRTILLARESRDFIAKILAMVQPLT